MRKAIFPSVSFCQIIPYVLRFFNAKRIDKGRAAQYNMQKQYFKGCEEKSTQKELLQRAPAAEKGYLRVLPNMVSELRTRYLGRGGGARYRGGV